MRAAEPVSGGDYLRTLTQPSGAWWRVVAVTLLGAIGLVVGSVAAVVALIVIARSTGHEGYGFDVLDGIDPAELLATNVGLAALIPISGGLVWAFYGVRPRWLSSHRPGLRWRWFLVCVGVSAAVWALLFALLLVSAVVTRESPIDSQLWMLLLVIVVTTPFQAAGEEYLFRGLILQGLGATRMAAWMACVISALLFATAHAQFAPPLFADRFVLGVAFAWITLRTGGLEAGIALHAIKNMSLLIPAAVMDVVDESLDPQGVTWIPLAIDVVLLAIALPWIAYLTRRWRDDGRLGGSGRPTTPAVFGVAPGPGWESPQPGWPPPSGWDPPPHTQPAPPTPWGGQPPPQPGGWPPPPGWYPPPPPPEKPGSGPT